MLGPNVLISNDDAIWLAPGAIDCDVAQFRALIREGSLAALGNAVDLYRNDFLADVTLREEAWTDWLTDERRRLEVEEVLRAQHLPHICQWCEEGDTVLDWNRSAQNILDGPFYITLSLCLPRTPLARPSLTAGL